MLAVRSAARHITQVYDQFLASSGLRTTQYSTLAKLKQKGPLTINALAREMVMDRSTLGRNICRCNEIVDQDENGRIRPPRQGASSDHRPVKGRTSPDSAARLVQRASAL